MAASSTAPDPARVAGSAVRRLRRDLEILRRSHNPQIAVMPAEDNLLEWHFVLHSLPSDTPYHEGCYHGKILFPPEYPLAPPALLMVTPSGRLETGHRLCLSMTDFHPESWNPAWSVETILVGLLSFFITDAERGYGAINATTERREQLAEESWAVNAACPEFKALFPEFLDRSRNQEQQSDELSDATALDAPVCGARDSEATAEAAPPAEIQLSMDDMPIVTQGAAAGSIACSRSPRQGSQSKVDPCANEHDLEAGRHACTRDASLPTVTPATTSQSSLDIGPEESADYDVEAPRRANAEGGEEDAPMECWICRDNTTNEPLIQPCACRGSMSGVHASCVEQWIQHHRRSAVNDERPRCSVCHQELRGYERRPGLHLFVRHLCYDAIQHILRTAVLVFLLLGYQIAAAGPDAGISLPVPMALRIIFIMAFAIVAIHKVLVLTVSLPLHRPPPRQAQLRRFFVSDYRSLAMHIAEAFAATIILLFWCVSGSLDWPFFLPFALAAVVPFFKIIFRTPSFACLKRLILLVVGLALAPFVVTWAILVFLYQNPQRVFHPLDAVWHIGVAVAAVPLCLLYASNVPVIVLWGVHSMLVAFGLIEILLVKRWQWQKGTLWWCALQLTALSAYVANAICEFPEGVGAPNHSSLVICLISCIWLGLVCALSFSVNWELIVRYYRTWQHRHGTFTLQVEQSRELSPEALTAANVGGEQARNSEPAAQQQQQ